MSYIGYVECFIYRLISLHHYWKCHHLYYLDQLHTDWPLNLSEERMYLLTFILVIWLTSLHSQNKTEYIHIIWYKNFYNGIKIINHIILLITANYYTNYIYAWDVRTEHTMKVCKKGDTQNTCSYYNWCSEYNMSVLH